MGVPLRVLIVEDSEDDTALVVRELKRAGYDIEFKRVDSGEALMSLIVSQEWDLVISDFSMPTFSGTDALKLVRSMGCNAPFIFVSGTIGEDTAVAALKDGAQDYIIKTNMKRLVPAVQRQLREAEEHRQRKGLEQHVLQLQKFEAIGRLAGGVAHDFNNLLGVILGQSEILLDRSKDQASTHGLEMIRESAKRGATLTRQLLAFGRRQVLETRVLNLNTILADVEKLLQRVIGEDIELNFQTDAKIGSIEADPGQLEQVVVNLATNARDAMSAGGRLTIATANVDLDEACADRRVAVRPGHYVQLVVSDTGCGMDSETQSHIFEPFFTTKEQGKGTGLGLATVYGIVKQSGGYIWVYSELGKGTCFKIYIPRVDQVEEHSGAPVPTAEVPTGTETVLLTEDEQDVREIAREFLESGGYKVVEAKDASDAIELARQHNGAIDLLVTDMVMPGMTGQELAVHLQREYPGLCVVFMSGYSEHAATEMANADPTVRLLSKPFSRGALLRTVRESLRSRKPN